MPKILAFTIVCIAIICKPVPLRAQPTAKGDYSAEAFVVEQDSTRIDIKNDGTYTRQSTGRIHIQSSSGVERYSVLSFTYENSIENLEIEYVRVRKQDGTTVSTPRDAIQDIATEITRQAPFYSDLREKHIPVKGLSAGDMLEFQCRWRGTKPLIPGQFWFAYSFPQDVITLAAQLEIRVPKDRPIKWGTLRLKPAIAEDGQSRVFTWTNSHLEHLTSEEKKKQQEKTAYEAARGKFPPPEIQISSFQSWEDLGRWYSNLQQDRVKVTPEIRSMAAELTRGLTDDNQKLHAIYNYVSSQFRYIAVDFGIGRYQPHSATEVLSNEYGDCKDKHTLLAALLEAAGIKAYPALINSMHDIDPDVPSPAQFDHVISIVSQGDHTTWLDTTPEVAPFGYLIGPLRDKRALIIPGDKSPRLEITPLDPPSRSSQTFQINAKLNETGTLEGRIERTIQGNDSELLLRLAFRNTPAPTWKDLIQQISYASGFAGDTSEVAVSAPEKLDEPLHFGYSYSRKDFPNWSNRRISSALPPIGLTSLDDEKSAPTHPIWLGSPMEVKLESHIELPKGYTPELPNPVDLNEDFAEYHSSYTAKDGILTMERHFIGKTREVPIAEYDAYKKFYKAVEADYERKVALSSDSDPSRYYQEEIWDLPYSENVGAAHAYDEARERYQHQDVTGEIAALNRALDLDPKFTRARLWLGEIYKSMGQTDHAIDMYRKAIELDPEQPVSYKALGLTLYGMQKYEEAVPTFQELTKIAPNTSDGPGGLGASLLNLKRYGEAIPFLETAVKIKPGISGLRLELAAAYLHAGDDEKAVASYQKALELDPRPMLFNDVAYALADMNKKLDVALGIAQKAVKGEEEASQKIRLSDLKVEDLAHAPSLAAVWDTLGWVYFQMGNLEQAEKYLSASWTLSLRGVPAEHLAQVYERQRNKPSAIHMYRAALFMLSQETGPTARTEAEKMRERLKHLAPGTSAPEGSNSADVTDQANQMRTIKMPRLAAGSANADFFLILSRGVQPSSAKVEDTKFINGSEELKTAAKSLLSATFQLKFPDDTQARIVRRGMLWCSKDTGCSFTLLPPDQVRSLN